MEILFYTSLLLLIASVFLLALRRPKQERDWVPEHEVPAHAEISGNTITLKNIINASYSSAFECSVKHYDKIFNVDDVESLWFLIEYFPMRVWPISFNLAHSFVTFGFRDGSFISISVAGRRKKGEKITFSRILPQTNEVVYKVINEADTVFARSFYEKDEVRLYKLKTTPQETQKVLISMLKEVNRLYKKPSWFDTFTRNCTTDMVRHLRAGGLKIPKWHPSYIFTTGVDKLFHNLGALDSGLPFAAAKERHNVTAKVQKLGKDAELSQKIRKFNS